MRLNSVEQKGYANRIMDWKIFVRQDLVVAKASEFFYEFVGENSFRPVSELLLPEDGELLKKAVEADTFQPLELITVLHNLKDSVRNVYLRLEQSEQTENGIPLYQITVSDIHDLENRNLRLEQSILKYRHFMTLEDVYFFEYLIEQDSITVYKYVNERAMNQFEGPMNALIRNVEQAHEGSDISRLEDQLRTFCAHLRNGDNFFEMEFVSGQEDKGIWKVKGARIPKKRDMVAGIITPDRNREKEAYYLTPAARDAGTGLLNKRAWTEYTIEQLNRKDHSTRWLGIIDIDDVLMAAHVAVVDVQHGLQAFTGIINRAVLKVDRNILLACTIVGIDIDDLTGRIKGTGVKGHGGRTVRPDCVISARAVECGIRKRCGLIAPVEGLAIDYTILNNRFVRTDKAEIIRFAGTERHVLERNRSCAVKAVIAVVLCTEISWIRNFCTDIPACFIGSLTHKGQVFAVGMPCAVDLV